MSKKGAALERPSARMARAVAEVAAGNGFLPEGSGDNTAVPARYTVMTFQRAAELLTLAGHGARLKDGSLLTMEQMRAGLGYEAAPELERLLIDQVVMCWLRVGEAEAMYSQVMGKAHNHANAAYAERRLSACLSRYVRTCEALARVRRLTAGVSVQVNVANQQIVTG